MSHILFAWELGEDLGHLAQLSVIAKEMVDRGHRVTVSVKDISRASLFFRDHTITIMQSPIWLPRPSRPRLTKTIADILAYCGYGSTTGLTTLVQAWSSLLNSISPDIVICDYAPTALLAAKRLGIPRVVLSNSFSFPEPGLPGQDICPWIPAPIEVVRRNEQQIIKNINIVSENMNFSPIEHISDIFSCDKAFITELPLLDHYKGFRQNSTYVGPAPSEHGFAPIDWGEHTGLNVLVYLKPGRPKVDTILTQLKDSNTTVRGFYPGRLPQNLKHAEDGKFKLTNTPVDIASSLEQADMVVLHGGNGTLCQAVLSGKPVFILPTQIEQTRNALRIQKIGNGDWIGKQHNDTILKERFEHFITSESMKQIAKTLAEENSNFQNYPFRKIVCDGIEAI